MIRVLNRKSKQSVEEAVSEFDKCMILMKCDEPYAHDGYVVAISDTDETDKDLLDMQRVLQEEYETALVGERTVTGTCTDMKLREGVNPRFRIVVCGFISFLISILIATGALFAFGEWVGSVCNVDGKIVFLAVGCACLVAIAICTLFAVSTIRSYFPHKTL